MHYVNKVIEKQSSGMLLLVRHAESEWNVLGKWTGRTDVHITEKGQAEARLLGEILSDIELHHAYTSEQIRTIETLSHLLEKAGQPGVTHESSPHLNERDYGDYTGLNKWEVLEQLGEDVFTKYGAVGTTPSQTAKPCKWFTSEPFPFTKNIFCRGY